MKFRIILLLTFSILLLTNCSDTKSEPKKLTDKEKLEQLIYRFKNPSKDYILACAHRGYWRSGPENSLLAVENAIAIGVDIIEIDVRKTIDNQLIVIHDKTINRNEYEIK